MKNKKTITIIAIIAIILILAGGVFGYLYFGTDTFKSNKDKFLKYIAQNKEISELLEDELITKYDEKKSEKAYENNGEIKINSNVGEASIDDVLKNASLTFDGKVDASNKKVQEDIKVSYLSQDAKMRYVQDGDKYGIKLDTDESDYIAIENNNLKEFAEKLGISDTSNIPDKLDLNSLQEGFFTKEELKKIYNTYYDILVKDLEDSDFEKVTEGNKEGYKLKLTDTKILQILNNILEKLKDDTLILEKIVKYSNDEYTVDSLKNEIESILEELKNETTENKEVAYITVYKENGKLVKTVIQILNDNNEDLINIIINKEETIANIEITITESGNTVNLNININKEKQDSNVKSNVTFKITSDDVNAELKIGAEYNNIKDLKEVGEKYTIGAQVNATNKEVSADMTITNNNKFVDNVETESLANVRVLNEYSSEELSEMFSGIQEAIQGLSTQTNLLNKVMGEEKDVTQNMLPDEEDKEEDKNDDEDNDEDNDEEEIGVDEENKDEEGNAILKVNLDE